MTYHDRTHARRQAIIDGMKPRDLGRGEIRVRRADPNQPYRSLYTQMIEAAHQERQREIAELEGKARQYRRRARAGYVVSGFGASIMLLALAALLAL